MAQPMGAVMAVPDRYAHINFKPTEAMAEVAARGLAYRERGGGGGLTTREAGEAGVGSGVQRATDIKNRRELTPDTIKRMVAFFDRHEKNAKIGAGLKPWEDRGHVAWLLWGGDVGRRWANVRLRQMRDADTEAGY